MGTSRQKIRKICAMIVAAIARSEHAWPPTLGLVDPVTVALSRVKRNRFQAELAEAHGVFPPTTSRAISTAPW